MTTARRSLLWCVLGTTLLPACAEELGMREAEVGGSGDKNTPHYNYYLDQLRSAASWAPETTGSNTVSALSDFGFEWRTGSSACLTQPAAALRVVGSRQVGARTIGSDALITVEGVERPLAGAERVEALAWLVNSAGRRDPVVLELTRGKAIASPDATWLEWPQFALVVRAETTCTELARAVVQFGPALHLPAAAGGAITTSAARFAAYASIYRSEHTALVAKAVIKGALPVTLGDEDDDGLLVECEGGTTVDAREVLTSTAFALGNGAWGALPGDGDGHPVQFFLTAEGFPIELHAAAVVGGHAPRLAPLCWGAAFSAAHGLEPLPRLGLPPETLIGFDAIHAGGVVLASNDRAAGLPTQLNRGTDQQRIQAFLEHTENPDGVAFAEQLATAVGRVRLGTVQGAFSSWPAARPVLTTRVAQLTVASPVAAAPPTGTFFVAAVATTGFDAAMPEVVGDGVCGPGEGGCPGDDLGRADPGACVLGCSFGNELRATPAPTPTPGPAPLPPGPPVRRLLGDAASR